MNVVQNNKKGAKPRRTGYRQSLNFQVIEEPNPEKVINQKVLK
jgi:hypothetical protein